MAPIRNIVVPYDFSEYSEAALRAAGELAAQLGAQLHLLHVLRPPSYLYASEFHGGASHGRAGESRLPVLEACRQELDTVAARSEIPTERIHCHVVEATSVAEAIDAEAERIGADLVAMGTHGRTGMAHLLMGSVAEATIRRAPCPVLTVPRASGTRVHTLRWETSRNPVTGAF